LDSTVYRDKKILKYSLTDVEIWAQWVRFLCNLAYWA
jgi:hypothetical protein